MVRDELERRHARSIWTGLRSVKTVFPEPCQALSAKADGGALGGRQVPLPTTGQKLVLVRHDHKGLKSELAEGWRSRPTM